LRTRQNHDYQRNAIEAAVETARNRPQRPRGQKKTAAEVQEDKDDAQDVLDQLTERLRPEVEKRWNVSPVAAVMGREEGRKRLEDFHTTMYWM
jgi:hypothetical protein